jgi:hypothetical protein
MRTWAKTCSARDLSGGKFSASNGFDDAIANTSWGPGALSNLTVKVLPLLSRLEIVGSAEHVSILGDQQKLDASVAQLGDEARHYRRVLCQSCRDNVEPGCRPGLVPGAREKIHRAALL